MPVMSTNPPGTEGLLAQFLSEQQSLTAVDRFSSHHDEGGPQQERFYRDLLPLR